MDLKTGRPDLARIVYRNLYELGTYYVLTDLATATALGLTPVTLQNATGDWVTPTPETLAAAVPGLQPQDDGTLAPNPGTSAGYPLTFVEYAMAPAQPLITDRCEPRTEAQVLLLTWLAHAVTGGQAELGGSGLVPLTPQLRSDAVGQVERVGGTPIVCQPDGPPPTDPPSTAPPTAPPASVTVPGSDFDIDGFTSGSGSGSGSGLDGSAADAAGGGSARPARPATPSTQRQSVRAAREAQIDLPDLQGIRSFNTLGPPLALLTIVALSTGLALSTAGYPTPAALTHLRRGAAAAHPAALARSPPGSAAARPPPWPTSRPASAAARPVPAPRRRRPPPPPPWCPWRPPRLVTAATGRGRDRRVAAGARSAALARLPGRVRRGVAGSRPAPPPASSTAPVAPAPPGDRGDGARP